MSGLLEERREITTPQWRVSATLGLFATTIFVSAALLFLVEPMIAKMILPRFGGAPAVWSTCMVFFQAALLAGYAYAHAVTSRFGGRRQVVLHAIILAIPLGVLPMALAPGWAPPPEMNPVAPLFGLLLLSAGLPFFVVATSTPLLQRWFALCDSRASRDPYVLYAASNAGSMLALVAYPLLVEPRLTLRTQSWIWTIGYGVLAIFVLGCSVQLWRTQVPKARDAESEDPNGTTATEPAPGAWTKARWVMLAFVPSSLMLGVTTYLTTDVSPVPLLWVIPLALYLLSFVLVFGNAPKWFRHGMVWAMPVALVVLAAIMAFGGDKLARVVPVHLAAFFVAAVVCHGELARTRPSTSFLTEFYLWVSLGGVLGGIFNGLVAPLIFNSVAEYRLALVAAALLLPALPVRWSWRWLRWVQRALPPCLACAVGGIFAWEAFHADQGAVVLYRQRTFFGVLSVKSFRNGMLHDLVHGRIGFGSQMRSLDPAERHLPLLYYFPTGPIGQVFDAFGSSHALDTVGVVGLGAGTLAAYGKAGQEFDFFEIDPGVRDISENVNLFTYLSDARVRGVRVRIVLGDARLTLEREPPGHYRLIVLDAFSGDAIPTHLMTREALTMYLEKLTDGGVLAFHISNKYLDLAPVLADEARVEGLAALVQNDDDIPDEDQKRWRSASSWAIIARHEKDLAPIAANGRWKPLKTRPGVLAWTDDYSNIFQVFRWK